MGYHPSLFGPPVRKLHPLLARDAIRFPIQDRGLRKALARRGRYAGEEPAQREEPRAEQSRLRNGMKPGGGHGH